MLYFLNEAMQTVSSMRKFRESYVLQKMPRIFVNPGAAICIIAFLFAVLCRESALVLVDAAVSNNITWGSENIYESSCPIRYPFFNETQFCASVGRQRAIVRLERTTKGTFSSNESVRLERISKGTFSSNDESSADVACASIPWRRREKAPEAIGLYVTNAIDSTHFLPSALIETNRTNNSNRIEGKVCFRIQKKATSRDTAATSSLFAVYFYPYAWSMDGGSGSYHSHFLDAASTLPKLEASALEIENAAIATFVSFESFSDFDARSSMEFVASDAEISRSIDNIPANRSYATWVSVVRNASTQVPRMVDLPYELAVLSPPNTTATMPANAHVIQVILYAARNSIEGVDVSIVDADSGELTDVLECVQTSGRNYLGDNIVPPNVRVSKGEVAALFFVRSGERQYYDGSRQTTRTAPSAVRIRISPKGRDEPIDVTVEMTSPTTTAHTNDTDDDVWALSRLGWLNSAVGLDASVTRPYSAIRPLRDNGSGDVEFGVRGRHIAISKVTGLPTSIMSNARVVLASEVVFEVRGESGSVIAFEPCSKLDSSSGFVVDESNVTWTSRARSVDGTMTRTTRGTLSYDGHLDISIELDSAAVEDENNTARFTLQSASLAFEIPDDIARFANGAGFADNGDFFPHDDPSRLDWSWQDFGRTELDPHAPAGDPVSPAGWRLWLGDANAGLFLKLKGKDIGWNSAAPRTGSVSAPRSWAGDDLKSGSLNVSRASNTTRVRVVASSGRLTLDSTPSSSSLLFNFSLIATPVKGDFTYTKEGREDHYIRSRHYHVPYGEWNPPSPCADLKSKLGLNLTTMILHQSNRLNPYIDYPYHPNVVPSLDAFIESANACNVDVQLYYTVGQLSNHAVELFALSQLNGEILLQSPVDRPPAPGPINRTSTATGGGLEGMGGNLSGNEWLLEHMREGYSGGWFTQNPGGEQDASIGDNVTSRFMNFYIEGQNWMFRKLGVNGLYYDGFNGERRIQQRIRRMSRNTTTRTGSTVKYNVHGRAFQNTELLPFVDSMWTCEGIDFTKGPAYWLVSISAIPYGTFGEMLGADNTPPVIGTFCGESCANKWRGMLFGMTNRAGWNGDDPNDNAGLWSLWDDVQISQAELYGWWNASNPVVVYAPATSDVKNGEPSADVLASSYVKHGGQTLVAVATWTNGTNADVRLKIDWEFLGLSASNATVTAPGISSFNRNSTPRNFPVDPSDGSVAITVPAYQGWLLVLG